MDHRIRTKAEMAVLTKEIPLDLLPLLSSYGRDRRVALRIERIPLRGRLTRGRNNGDGSWSVTRDELEGLCYIPPKGGNEAPTLVVRVIGLENDNGATLAVLDYEVLPEDADDPNSADPSVLRQTELKQLRAELAKTKTSLRTSQSELAAARQLWEAEIEERLAEAAAEAEATLEKKRAEWQDQAKDRAAKSDARIENRLAQAREAWKRDAENDLAKAEQSWKDAEAERLAAAETRWREQSERALEKEHIELKRAREALAAARADKDRNSAGSGELRRLSEEIEAVRADLGDREARLVEANNALTQTRERARAATQAVLSNAERVWKSGEAARLAAAESKWQEQSSLVLSEMAKRLERAEAAVTETRAHAISANEPHDLAELQELHDELSAARAALAEREKQLAETRLATSNDRKRIVQETEAALARARASWKNEEDARTAAAKAQWQEESARETAELTVRFETNERALAEARSALAERGKQLAERDKQLTDTRVSATGARKRVVQESEAAIAQAREAWKGEEETRLAAAKSEWQKKSARDIAALTARLETAERTLAQARIDVKGGQERRETADVRRLKDTVRQLQSTLETREAELKAAQEAETEAAERAARDVEIALGKAEKDWEARESARFAEAKAQWQEQSERILKKARMKLEGAEAALAEARATANSAQDLREGAELRRLRSEFTASREKITSLESELSQAQLVAGQIRERTREEIDAGIAKAEEAWKSNEAVRTAAVETQERERGARALAEVAARLERTEIALKDARTQAQGERERASVALAELLTRYERTESQLKDAQTRIESMRDPANEGELEKLRNELASVQIAYSELEGEVGRTRAEVRRMRDRATEVSKAAVLRAEEVWRIDEAKRLATARREWERDSRFVPRMDMAVDEPIASAPMRRANRLLLDSALAVGLAAIVVLIVTFSPELPDIWPSPARATGSEIPKSVDAVKPALPKSATVAPRAIVAVAAANMRGAPAVSGQVIVRLHRGDVVAPGERHGDWTRVHMDGTAAKPARDGWIYTASLKSLPPH